MGYLKIGVIKIICCSSVENEFRRNGRIDEMKNILEYKGYITKIEYSTEDKVLYGKIEGIKDLVNFESESVDKIEKEFHSAVDDYLQLCSDLGQEPDKVYSGTFNIRITPTLHRAIAYAAIKNGESLNSTVERAINAYVGNE